MILWDVFDTSNKFNKIRLKGSNSRIFKVERLNCVKVSKRD